MMTVQNLLIDEPPLQILPSLAKLIGLNEAIVLQQLHYWLRLSKHEYDGRRWVYNTYDGWSRQFSFWTPRTIRHVFSKLKKAGLLLEDNFNKRKFDRTPWYSINYKQISTLLKRQKCQMQETEMSDRCDNPCRMDVTDFAACSLPRDYTETNEEAGDKCYSTREKQKQHMQGTNMSLLKEGESEPPMSESNQTYFTAIKKTCNAIYRSHFKSAMPCGKEMPAQLERTADHFERELGPDGRPLDTKGALRLLAVAFEAYCLFDEYATLEDPINKWRHSYGCFAMEIPRWVQIARRNERTYLPLEKPEDVLKLDFQKSKAVQRAEAFSKRNPDNQKLIWELIKRAKKEDLTYEEYIKQQAGDGKVKTDNAG